MVRLCRGCSFDTFWHAAVVGYCAPYRRCRVEQAHNLKDCRHNLYDRWIVASFATSSLRSQHVDSLDRRVVGCSLCLDCLPLTGGWLCSVDGHLTVNGWLAVLCGWDCTVEGRSADSH